MRCAGRVQAQGKLSWADTQAWGFDVRAQSLAIGDLRPGVDGRVSATGR